MKGLLKDLKKCLTTELLFHELYDNTSIYSDEFDNRMKLLGIDENIIENFRNYEETIIEESLEEGKRSFALKNYWKDQSYIAQNRLIIDLRSLTVSEILAMIEEAVYYKSGLFKLPKLINNVVDYLANEEHESLYQHELIERLKKYGFEKNQINAFIYNEYLILQQDYYEPEEMKERFGCSSPWSKECVDKALEWKVGIERYLRDLK